MATERRAEVVWEGSLMEGEGTIERVGSGALPELPVTWASRAETPEGRTSPEELIAAAHASCFAMALSHALAQAGTPPERLETSATITFVPGTGITTAALTVRGRVPGLDAPAFQQAAEGAKDGCPVSGALKGNVELTLDATLDA
jgi:lipoyl-dependent peroxiredoxin